MRDIHTLRVSLARVAQALRVETTDLPVLKKDYSDLCEMAENNDWGWNALAYACAERANEIGAAA